MEFAGDVEEELERCILTRDIMYQNWLQGKVTAMLTARFYTVLVKGPRFLLTSFPEWLIDEH